MAGWRSGEPQLSATSSMPSAMRNRRSIGGCQYFVGHPGGVNSSHFPVNALEAESRRAARFVNLGHTTGQMLTRIADPHPDAPCTLDLRWPGA